MNTTVPPTPNAQVYPEGVILSAIGAIVERGEVPTVRGFIRLGIFKSTGSAKPRLQKLCDRHLLTQDDQGHHERRNRMNTQEMEIALADWLDWRVNLIVPNVSYGLHLHECDLLSISRSGYATEIEIKVSASDLKADHAKRHQHRSDKIKFLYFAIPKTLMDRQYLVPEHAGIISVYSRAANSSSRGYCQITREAKANPSARPLTTDEQMHLAHLGCMRMWNLKRKALNPDGLV